MKTFCVDTLGCKVNHYEGEQIAALLSELFFVQRTPFPMRFGGSLGNMIDPMTQIRLRGRRHGAHARQLQRDAGFARLHALGGQSAGGRQRAANHRGRELARQPQLKPPARHAAHG